VRNAGRRRDLEVGVLLAVGGPRQLGVAQLGSAAADAVFERGVAVDHQAVLDRIGAARRLGGLIAHPDRRDHRPERRGVLARHAGGPRLVRPGDREGAVALGLEELVERLEARPLSCGGGASMARSGAAATWVGARLKSSIIARAVGA